MGKRTDDDLKRSWCAMSCDQGEPTGEGRHLRKKFQAEVVDVAYAHYGMSRGVVESDKARYGASQSCAVMTNGWPSWAFAARASGWRIMLIVLTDAEWLGFTVKCFEGVDVRLLNDLPTGFMWPAVDATFSGLDLGSKVSMWSMVSSFIVMARAARRKPASWTVQLISLSHVACGGVTDGTWKVNLYTPTRRGQSHIS